MSLSRRLAIRGVMLLTFLFHHLHAGTEVVKVRYRCEAKKQLTAEYYNGQSEKVRVWGITGRPLLMNKTVSASGIRYATPGEKIVFWSKGPEAFVEKNGKPFIQGCKETAR